MKGTVILYVVRRMKLDLRDMALMKVASRKYVPRERVEGVPNSVLLETELLLKVTYRRKAIDGLLSTMFDGSFS